MPRAVAYDFSPEPKSGCQEILENNFNRSSDNITLVRSACPGVVYFVYRLIVETNLLRSRYDNNAVEKYW